jgi:diguanylate cyclase (GGDEF)-like protein
MIDVDHFKSVNDRFGHPVGDRVLAALAALLRRRLRQSDRVGRYGGEEFATLIEDLPEHEVVRLVERLLAEFGAMEHHAADGETFKATFSAGVAMLRPGMTLDDWKKAADDALYAAKKGGRNRVMASGAARPAAGEHGAQGSALGPR